MLTAPPPKPAELPRKVVARAWPTWQGGRFTGCMRDVQQRPLELYTRVQRELGDLVRLRALPGAYFYLLGHPDAVDHVLHANHKNYRKPDVFNNSIVLLAGNGILRSEGEFWRKQRRLVQPAFLKSSVARLSTLMVDSIRQFVEEWDQQADDRTLDVVPEMMRLGLRIASRTLFSTDISSDADSIGGAYRTAFEYVSLKLNSQLMFYPTWLPTRLNREFKRSKQLLDQVVLDLIARRRNQPPQGDTLDLLLAAQEDGRGMSDDQLKDEAITLLTAGHETIGAALSWTWYLLASHPEIQEQLFQEVSAHLGGRLPTVEDLPSLPWTTAAFEETMRLYPPAWGVPRETIEPDEICGYPVPAKAVFVVSQWLVHRHPAYWPQPERFDPTRFLPPQNEGRHRFAYFPFGGGPRICIGNHFAMVEGPLALAALAQRFRFSLVPDQRVELDPTFTLRPKNGVHVVVRKRT